MNYAEILYFSPHLDDAVFSCAGTIYKQTSTGTPVKIVTIFSGDGKALEKEPQNAGKLKRVSLSLTAHSERIKEDIRAVEMCGATHLHLGFLDAPYRNEFYRNLHTIFGPMHSDDIATIEIIQQKMDAVLEGYGATETYIPLGIGGHVDHRLTFLAAQSLRFTGKIHFYEDRPYVFAPRSLQHRLRQLGVTDRPVQRENFNPVEIVKFLGSLNFRGEFCPALLTILKLARNHLSNSYNPRVSNASLKLQPRLEILDSATAEGALQAIARYTSQIIAITGTIDKWSQCSQRYSRRSGTEKAERYWSVCAG